MSSVSCFTRTLPQRSLWERCALRSRFTHASDPIFQRPRWIHASLARRLNHVSPRNVLPQPEVEVGPLGLNRLQEHYRGTLAADLLYMTYEHKSDAEITEEAERRAAKVTRTWDPSDPYTVGRPARALRGNRRPQPGPTLLSPENPSRHLTRIDKVVISCFIRDAIVNKHTIIPVIAQLRAITGAPVVGSLADSSTMDERTAKKGYIKVIRAKSGVASFKLRKGMPVGVQAVLPGQAALEFLDALVTFVLPRLRTFNGFALPPSSQPPSSPAAVSGVVSLGMGPETIPLFPQLEINWDSYPGKSYGFQIDCVTNQRGKKATDKARALLSGLGIPFVRRGDLN